MESYIEGMIYYDEAISKKLYNKAVNRWSQHGSYIAKHTELVLAYKAPYVYAVEGNSNDRIEVCKRNTHYA